jgi:hypothetical protein
MQLTYFCYISSGCRTTEGYSVFVYFGFLNFCVPKTLQKICAKTLDILSHTRLSLIILHWKQNGLLLGRLLLVADYTS